MKDFLKKISSRIETGAEFNSRSQKDWLLICGVFGALVFVLLIGYYIVFSSVYSLDASLASDQFTRDKTLEEITARKERMKSSVSIWQEKENKFKSIFDIRPQF